jgi:predicted transposase YdaD
MILPEGLKQTFWEELRTYEEERKMPYITSVEQIGYDRGIKQGKASGFEEGERSIILRLLNRRFRHLNDRTIAQITTLSTTQLESLREELLDFSAIEDLTTWLDNH